MQFFPDVRMRTGGGGPLPCWSRLLCREEARYRIVRELAGGMAEVEIESFAGGVEHELPSLGRNGLPEQMIRRLLKRWSGCIEMCRTAMLRWYLPGS
jgi:hypothetical protein